MDVDVSQRGSGPDVRFLPPDDRFDPRGYEIELSKSDADVRAFVEAEHYSGSFPSARERAVMRDSSTGRIVAAAVLKRRATPNRRGRPSKGARGLSLGLSFRERAPPSKSQASPAGRRTASITSEVMPAW